MKKNYDNMLNTEEIFALNSNNFCGIILKLLRVTLMIHIVMTEMKR